MMYCENKTSQINFNLKRGADTISREINRQVSEVIEQQEA